MFTVLPWNKPIKKVHDDYDKYIYTIWIRTCIHVPQNLHLASLPRGLSYFPYQWKLAESSCNRKIVMNSCINFFVATKKARRLKVVWHICKTLWGGGGSWRRKKSSHCNMKWQFMMSTYSKCIWKTFLAKKIIEIWVWIFFLISKLTVFEFWNSHRVPFKSKSHLQKCQRNKERACKCVILRYKLLI